MNRALRRDLRRRFNQGPLEPVVSRPGARFYVTARNGTRTAFLLGPYASHMTALTNVARGRQLAEDAFPDEAQWCAFGTASTLSTRPTRFGR